MCGCLSPAPPTGDLACNPGMCPDWESNQQLYGSQASAQSTEPHQPRMFLILYFRIFSFLTTWHKKSRQHQVSVQEKDNSSWKITWYVTTKEQNHLSIKRTCHANGDFSPQENSQEAIIPMMTLVSVFGKHQFWNGLPDSVRNRPLQLCHILCNSSNSAASPKV